MLQNPLSGNLFAFINRRATQALSCPPALVGVMDGCRADVSFVAGMIIDKFAYRQPLYRQQIKLRDSGINVSRAWVTKLMPAAVSLIGLNPALASHCDGRNADQGRSRRPSAR